MKKVQSNCFVATVVILLALDVVLTTTSFAGGDKYSPRLVGMGRAFTAFSRGLDAVGVNPANLALNDRDATITINLAPVGFSIGSDLINLQIYNDYFTGVVDPATGDRVAKFLTDEFKRDARGDKFRRLGQAVKIAGDHGRNHETDTAYG